MRYYPNDYRRLIYIESTGTQWIDTGFVPNSNTRIVIDVEMTSASKAVNCFIGCRSTATQTDKNNNIIWSMSSGANLTIDYYGSRRVYTKNMLNNRCVIDKNKNITYVDNEKIATNVASTSVSNLTAYLFAVHEISYPSYQAPMKLYSCQIYDNDVLIRDYIPCKNSDGVVGLYDAVNGQFYTNAGAGEFIAGTK